MSSLTKDQNLEIQKKVVSEYLSSKMEEILKKHCEIPSKPKESTNLEPIQTLINKLEGNMSKEITQNQKNIEKSKTYSNGNGRLKSSSILTKTINNRNKITIKSITNSESKKQSKSPKIKSNNKSTKQPNNVLKNTNIKSDESLKRLEVPLNKENLEILENLSGQIQKKTIQNTCEMASSMVVNASDTLSNLDDKHNIKFSNENKKDFKKHSADNINMDKSIEKSKSNFANKKNVSVIKNKSGRSKSTNLIFKKLDTGKKEKNENKSENLKQEIINGENNKEIIALEHEIIKEEPNNEHNDSHYEKVENELNIEREHLENELIFCEKEMKDKSDQIDINILNKISELQNPGSYSLGILTAFEAIFAGTNNLIDKEFLGSKIKKWEELQSFYKNNEEILNLIKNFKSLVEQKKITDKNIFFALETLNKSYDYFSEETKLGINEELAKITMFLQKGIEYYKIHKNYMIQEKIKKLTVPDQYEKIEEEEHTLENEKVESPNNLNVTPIQNEEKMVETKKNEEKIIKGKKQNKNDDVIKLKKEINEIKLNNSKLFWDIERERKKIEKLCQLQEIQKELNENYEIDKKYKEYLNEKNKNEKQFIKENRQVTLESLKIKKEIENKIEEELKKEIRQKIIIQMKWSHQLENQRISERHNDSIEKSKILEESKEIKKKNKDDEKRAISQEINSQRLYKKEFQELLKKKNELEKEYKNLSLLKQNHEKKTIKN